ncbi:hypothetical protein ACIBCM_23930 [Streptomyces sp. NPDC051018]|uniref:hypothetical protein n=1 Tax=Streptomyces sp. NPDC051018 TaxID=3365639 RepID=UPI003797F638
MDLRKPAPGAVPDTPRRVPAPAPEPEGCLAVAVRVPVRIVVLIVVVPVRLVWDLLALTGRATHRALLRPLGNALVWLYEHALAPAAYGLGLALLLLAKLLLVWPFVGLWRYVVVPVWTYGIAVPSVWVYRSLLTPLGHGLSWAAVHLLARPGGRLFRSVLAPALKWAGLALFVWPFVGLWRFVVVPVWTYGIAVPSVWVYRSLLTPLGHGTLWLSGQTLRLLGLLIAGIGRATGWIFVYLLFKPLAWVVLQLLAPPLGRLWRRVLKPVGAEIAAAIGVAWRIAGYLTRALGDGLLWLLRTLVTRPARWFYQNVCVPVGHTVRDVIWRPVKRAAIEAGEATRSAFRSAREAVGQARQSAWRALGGGKRVPEPVEPVVPPARTLGRKTTVPGTAAGPEISLHKRG